jgi:hypothetical protein
MDSQDFAMHFLDETLSQNVVHIDDFPLLGDAQVALGILSSCITRQPFYFTWTIPFSFVLSFLTGFNKKVMQLCGDIMGPGSWEFFSRPLNKALGLTTDIFWWYKPFFHRGLCPICLSRDLGFGGFKFVL